MLNGESIDLPSICPADGQKAVGLFVTCLANSLWQRAAKSTYDYLISKSVIVDIPSQQTCCGQPLTNSGYFKHVDKLAGKILKEFSGYQDVIAPSASCAAALKNLLKGRDANFRIREFCEFLECHDLFPSDKYQKPRKIILHESCSSLRQTNSARAVRSLLKRQKNIEVSFLQYSDECCGFGGTFASKFPDISTKLSDNKLRDIQRTGIKNVASCDVGCLLQLQGRSSRLGLGLNFYHVSEILNGDML